MCIKLLLSLLLLLGISAPGVSQETIEKSFTLKDVRYLIHQNRSVIVGNMSRDIAAENLSQQKSLRLPEIMLDGDGHLLNNRPMGAGSPSASNSFLYQFKLSSEFDVYVGGRHTYAIERMQKEHRLSQERLDAVEQDVQLKAYILLYDIHRNIKYRDFIISSIHLREKEYERIDQLYKNGYVLKSDLLRSKLYITDLQKKEVEISNSIVILSDQFCRLLGLNTRYLVRPDLDDDLDYKIINSFEVLFSQAILESPHLKMQRTIKEREETALKEIYALRRPSLKIYANYGVGSPAPVYDFNHQLGGEVGAKLSFSLSSFYKSKHQTRAQKRVVEREKVLYDDEEERLRNTLYEMYTRYHESLLNIDRALEKIDMSEESHRILTNSYYNQQALLIDVLESETKSMEASFEWVEAVVDSQKYYWALKQLCGAL